MLACTSVGRVAAGQYTPVMCACTVRRVVGVTSPPSDTRDAWSLPGCATRRARLVVAQREPFPATGDRAVCCHSLRSQPGTTRALRYGYQLRYYCAAWHSPLLVAA